MLLRFISICLYTALIASADPLTITFSGRGNGTLGGAPFVAANFSFTLTTDTSNLVKPPCCQTWDTPPGTPTSFTITGLGSGTLTDNQVFFVLPSESAAGIAHYNDGDVIDFTHPSLAGYDLRSNLGPLTATPTFVGNSVGTTCTSNCLGFETSAGPLIFTTVSTVTFQAQVTAPDLPAITAVVNAGSFQPGVRTNSWATIFGTNLAPATREWNTKTEIINGKLPIQLDGTSVTINGKAAVVAFISPGQLNVLVPDDSSLGPVEVKVTTAKGTSQAFSATLQKYAPGFFQFQPQSGRYAAALLARKDGGVDYCGPATLFGGALATRPVDPAQDVLELWGTGFGPTDPAVPWGMVFSGAAPLSDPVQITIGGVPATVHFAGVTAAGLFQFNVTVPPLPDGDHKVEAIIGGVQSQGNLYVSVKN